jgi:hypothetical protein
VRLSCNLILNGRVGEPSIFYSAGSAIPDHLVPTHARPYRISEAEGRALEKELAEWREMVAARKEKKTNRGIASHASS